MDVKFIAQGLDIAQTSPLGEKLAEALSKNVYKSFSAFVAFVSVGGIKNIEEQLLQFKSRGGDIRLYIGVDLHGTSKEALDRLLELDVTTYIVFSPNGIVYHPKVYSLEGDVQNFLSVGSSNLTTSGLYQNVEASVCFTWDDDDEQGAELYSDVCEHFNSLLSMQTTSCQLLTQEIIDLLVSNNIVLSESTSRAIANKVKKESEATPVTNNEKLLEVFGKLKLNRPPKGHKKTIEEEVLNVASNNESTISFKTSDFHGGVMWIMCGKMTGGSQNILDLSKKGKREGVAKFGSIEFFGIDKNDTDQSLDIDIIHNGKTYIGNHIFFAPDNSNWRIQLKGVTEDGSKLTEISKARLGYEGFRGKILLFGKTDKSNSYNLSVVKEDELDKLRDLSTDWAFGGHGRGRSYGIIE